MITKFLVYIRNLLAQNKKKTPGIIQSVSFWGENAGAAFVWFAEILKNFRPAFPYFQIPFFNDEYR